MGASIHRTGSDPWRMQRLVVAAALALGLAACSREPESVAPAAASMDTADRGSASAAGEGPGAAATRHAPAEPEPAAGATTGGDGSGIRLDPLQADDIRAAALPGELGCSFADEDGAVLLIAMGDAASDAAARGAIKPGGEIAPIAAPGGFDALVDGGSFEGQGSNVRIEPTGPATGGGESPPRPATLTYDRADGARRTIAGRWTCGP
ncbi:hypothetical protein [Coralloluteibacterium stylophorae]|uniref:Uncharacterized protein n=1 Tax=Coralloluteibacterium stylophorae TaxID=1776034 RepID=A0A8J7VRQ8_9GAMM|nr:hypothetical protein [Coralloluteibacterium stylophorae]MBS7455783.1 hypothetical protein [Coralloluteibacterium stylophorae]